MANHPNRSSPPLARTLSARRIRQGLTQPEIAARYGIAVRTWEEWEQRDRSPRGPLAAFTAQLLDEIEALEARLTAIPPAS